MHKTSLLIPLILSILTILPTACTVDATGEAAGPAIPEQTVEDNLRHAALLALASDPTTEDETFIVNDAVFSVDDALVHFHTLEVARDMSRAVGHVELTYPEGTATVEFNGDPTGVLTFDSGHEGTLTLTDETNIQQFSGKDPVRLAITLISSCENLDVIWNVLTLYVNVSCQSVIGDDVLGRVVLDNLVFNLIGLTANGRIAVESADLTAELIFSGHEIAIKVGRDEEKASLLTIAFELLTSLL
ncbi:MAG: hypothetical protein AAGC55_01715 [Myxococcota bacterium]